MDLSSSVTKQLAKELHQLTTDGIDGVCISFNDDNLGDISIQMNGPDGTPFEGGCFKLKMTITPDYPNVPPKCVFLSKIFHPNVSSTGEICVNTLKKDWKREYGIKHALMAIRCLLIAPNPESALNEEAGRLILEEYESYVERAKLMTSIHAVSEKPHACNVSENQASDNVPSSTKKRPAEKKKLDAKKKSLKRL